MKFFMTLNNTFEGVPTGRLSSQSLVFQPSTPRHSSSVILEFPVLHWKTLHLHEVNQHTGLDYTTILRNDGFELSVRYKKKRSGNLR